MLCHLHWLPVRRRVEFKLACLVRQALCGHMPTLMISISSPKATDDPFGLPLITCARYHVRTITIATETEALALPVREFGTVCHVACEQYKHFKTLLKTYMFD